MTDADTVQNALGVCRYSTLPCREKSYIDPDEWCPECNARAALDRLVAERDAARQAQDSSDAMHANLLARADAAEAERDRLRESLRGLVTAVDHYRDFEPEWNPEYEWSQESTDAWKRIEEILDANVDAARKALGGHQ